MKYMYLICPFVALVLCQITKFLFECITTKKMDFKRLFNGSGGMPSAHTSFSTSLTMLIGFKEGFSSTIFAVALVFTLITSYDALGVRYESGKHAELLNAIMNKEIKDFKMLKEKLGHEPFEVLVGFFVGTLTAFVFNMI